MEDEAERASPDAALAVDELLAQLHRHLLLLAEEGAGAGERQDDVELHLFGGARRCKRGGGDDAGR